ncbi:MAG: iron-containing alcohol dehydrogenase [Zetaproteobacteria bacterium]|nr:iron-containing alcohol dehydrogenase [Zetaproteobacteria bacterium]OIO13075.1 MAG: NADH-dependent alcohol dehydrogenase [Flavobacteriaceae bacterium CG1_02_35_72]PIR13921.1 MAG: NADH-dependent alcohol dehydrogenase [Flavobacteriales bacterium CG11_big_fil_rev_8_21_14_0_20_35_7]PJA06271.1 MAG: NADH-dependent alcohol dehydrogenase [Flavobacteriales bacterium CG_4_10_14_0_2_um_filter_35_18]
MNNFEFYNPVKMIFGKDQLFKLADEIPNNAKILMTYGGGSIKKNGIYNQVKKALQKFEVLEFGGIEANPHFETLVKAVDLAKHEKINFILAVGGGSVIDGTKFIAAAISFEGADSWDILSKNIKVTKAIPFGCVLTLPATGSEMNSGGVITKVASQEKMVFGSPVLFPKFSFNDPQVITSLPKRQLQNGVVDAFTHVMEQYLTYNSGALLQDRMAEGVLQTLVEIGAKVIENPSDYKRASNFMWCCTMALNGLLSKGVPTDWATHMIGHELTALYGLDHAQSLAVIGPNLYTVMKVDKHDKLVQYGKRVWNLTGSDALIAEKAIEKTSDFFKSLGVKTKLSEYTKDYNETASFITKRFKARGWLGLGEHQHITLEKVKEIVEMSY